MINQNILRYSLKLKNEPKFEDELWFIILKRIIVNYKLTFGAELQLIFYEYCSHCQY